MGFEVWPDARRQRRVVGVEASELGVSRRRLLCFESIERAGSLWRSRERPRRLIEKRLYCAKRSRIDNVGAEGASESLPELDVMTFDGGTLGFIESVPPPFEHTDECAVLSCVDGESANGQCARAPGLIEGMLEQVVSANCFAH